jgi:hypothetical protein
VSYLTHDFTGTTQRSAAQLYPDSAFDWWDRLRNDTVYGNLSAALADHAALRAATGEAYNHLYLWCRQRVRALLSMARASSDARSPNTGNRSAA